MATIWKTTPSVTSTPEEANKPSGRAALPNTAKMLIVLLPENRNLGFLEIAPVPPVAAPDQEAEASENSY